ncbi:5'/3'-nucleotidase SurE [soil metagenome]
MRILLTNDDGIAADGLVSLERIAERLGGEIWVCAPEREQSGASRALTLADPLRARKISERRFAVDGTPTDCVMLAIQQLMPDKPDLVLSGVNRGQNLAEDVTMSGTVAGAIQGMALGVPSVALSQAMFIFHDDLVANYATAEVHAPGIIRKALAAGWPKDVILNLNFPDLGPDEVKEVEVTRQGFRDSFNLHFDRRTDLRGRDYYWMGFRREPSNPPDGTDIKAIYDGRISVTPLHIDLTHMPTVHALKQVLGGSPPKA